MKAVIAESGWNAALYVRKIVWAFIFSTTVTSVAIAQEVWHSRVDYVNNNWSSGSYVDFGDGSGRGRCQYSLDYRTLSCYLNFELCRRAGVTSPAFVEFFANVGSSQKNLGVAFYENGPNFCGLNHRLVLTDWHVAQLDWGSELVIRFNFVNSSPIVKRASLRGFTSARVQATEELDRRRSAQ